MKRQHKWENVEGNQKIVQLLENGKLSLNSKSSLKITKFISNYSLIHLIRFTISKIVVQHLKVFLQISIDFPLVDEKIWYDENIAKNEDENNSNQDEMTFEKISPVPGIAIIVNCKFLIAAVKLCFMSSILECIEGAIDALVIAEI